MGATEVIQALVSPAEKLIEAVSKAIGKAYEPKHIRKMADAKAYELKVISEIVRNNSDVPIVYDSTGVSIDTSNYEEIAKRASSRLAYQEIAKQQNIEAVVDKAYDELMKESVVSEDPVDSDWMLRFFNSVENISNDDMQKIWAHILAGEIKAPHTYSYRTLEKLRNMTQHEAQNFQILSSLAMKYSSTFFVLNNNEILNQYDVYFKNILELEECGLMTAHQVTLNLNVSAKQQSCIYNPAVVGLISGKTEEMKKLSVSVYVFTESGAELIKAIQPIANQKYILECLEYIRNSNSSDYVISAHNVNFIDENGEINFSLNDILPSREA